MVQSRELTFTRYLVGGSLAISMALVVVLVLRAASPSRVALLGGLAGLAVTCWVGIGLLARTNRRFEWMLSIALLNMLILVPELALRVAKFEYVSKIEFGSPRAAAFESLVPDERLFWRLPSSLSDVNSLGFHGGEVDVPRSKDTYRILYLGDSCTDYGFPRNYPAIAESLLNERLPSFPKPFERVVLALGGYTSHQGRVLADLYGERFDPDMVVVFYGWNDHWLARGAVDAEKAIRISKWSNVLNRLSQGSRLLQAFIELSVFLKYGNTDALLDEVRVPIDAYRENLLHIVSIFRPAGIPIIFLTAPTSHYRIGVPDYLMELGYARDKQSVVELHQAYNRIVREVADETSSSVVDLERFFNAAERIEEYFISDGIHATSPGRELMAQSLVEGIVQLISDDSTRVPRTGAVEMGHGSLPASAHRVIQGTNPVEPD